MQAFEKAEIAKYNPKDLYEYEQSLKVYRDLKAVIDTAFDEGKLEGIMEIAQKMKSKGVDTADIAEMTGLSEAEIAKL